MKRFFIDAASAIEVFQQMPGLISVYDVQTKTYVYANKAFAKCIGKRVQDVIGMDKESFLAHVHPEDKNCAALLFLTSKAQESCEFRIRHKNGTWISLNTEISIIQEKKEQKPRFIIYLSTDITKQKAMDFSQRFFTEIVASSDDVIVSKTLQGIITSWNKSAHKIFGYTAKEAIGKHISIIIPPELLSEEEKIISTLKRGDHVDHYETIRVTKSGKRIYVSLSISPIKDARGNIIGAAKIARDITERKRYQDDLKASQERLQIAVDAGKIGIWDWDIKNDQIVWSDRVYEIHGMDKRKPIGKLNNYQSAHHPDDAERIRKAIEDALKGNKPYREEFRIITPSGETRWVETKAKVIRDADGTPIRMLGATTNITQRKRLEQQKTEFIGIASHELKTPVTSLKAYAQILEQRFKKEGDEVAASFLNKMNAQLNKLTTLISDLLDVTKIESGKLAFTISEFDFNQLVMEIIDEIQPTTTHQIITDLAQTKIVRGDRDRIGQVLSNFLTNASKYSPSADKIIVTTKMDKAWITLSVQDFGVGIPAKSLEKVFERFYRISEVRGQTFPGVGLGLFISSEIIKRLHGKIWAESTVGKGSTFSFCLPLNSSRKSAL